jgi:hypothetical protein
MKNRVATLACTVLVLSIVGAFPVDYDAWCTASAQTDRDALKDALDEEILIRRAIEELYVEGLKTRDFALIEEVCIPETRLMSIGRDGKPHITTLSQWSKKFDPEKPPFEELDYSILKIDREGTAAQVKVLFIVNSQRRVTDFLNMLKVDGRWRVVNIIDY